MREFLRLRLVFLQVRFLTYALHFQSTKVKKCTIVHFLVRLESFLFHRLRHQPAG